MFTAKKFVQLFSLAVSLLATVSVTSTVFASPGTGGSGSTIQYNPTGYIAQGVLAPNGGTYPNDSYQLLITGPTDASATNQVSVTVGFSVINAPAGINAQSFISASPQTLTFNSANQAVPVTISIVVPSSAGGASTAGSYAWLVKPINWPTAANVAIDEGATVNGLASDAPVAPTAPVINNLLPGNGTSYIYTGTPITFPISFDATATGGGANALITGLGATIDGVPFNGGLFHGLLLPVVGVTNLLTLNASGLVTSPGITDSGTHTITVSATNGVATTTATTVINILTPPKITNTNNPTFTYGQAGTTFTVTTTGFPAPTFSATGLPAGATINPTTGVISGTPTAAGSFSFTVTAANSFNGTPVGTATKTFTLTVNPAARTVTASAASKTYGASDPASLTYTLNAPLFGTDTLGGSLTRVAGQNVGTYAINQGTLTANSNYTLTYVGANFSITRATLLVTAANASKVYGAANPSFTASIGGFVNGDTATSGAIGGSAGVTSSATTASPVGTYSIVAGIGDLSAANYTFSFVNGTLTVTKAPLTITADNKTRVYGVANPALTATYAGLITGDSASAVTGLVLSTAATTTSSVGTYDINAAGGTAPNYALTQVKGTLTITKADQSITFNALPGKAVGDAAFALTATASSGLAITYSSSNTSVATVSGSTVTIVGVGTVTITAAQAGNANYTAAASVLQTFTVAPAQNVKKTVSGKVFFDVDYDGNFDASEYGLDGVSIKLYNSSNHVVASDVTESHGLYSMADISPGTYTVVASAPDGFGATTVSERHITIAAADMNVPDFGFGLNFCDFHCMTASALSQGFWKNNVTKALTGKATGTQVSTATMTTLTNKISALAMSPFDGLTLTSAKTIFNGKVQLQLQLLAAEYNYANGAYIDDNEALTFAFIYWGEMVLKNTNGTYNSSYQTFAAQWFEAYNTSEGGRVDGPSS